MDPFNAPQIDVEAVDPAQALLDQEDQLQIFGAMLAKKRDEWMRARASSGVDKRFREDADQYHGRDAANRASSGMMSNVEAGFPVTVSQNRPTRSTLFVGVTRQKTNAAEARLADIVLPSDDRNFGIDPMNTPEMLRGLRDADPMVDPSTGQPAINPSTGQPFQMRDVAMAAHRAAQAKSDAMQDEIDDQLTESDYNGEVRKVLHDAAMFGTGVLKGPVVVSRTRKAWTKQTDATGQSAFGLEIVRNLQPSSFRADPRNCWPDPTCGDNIHNGRGHFEREVLNTKQVRELAKQPQYLRAQLIKVLDTKPKITKALDDLRDTDNRDLSQDDVYDRWEYWGEVDAKDVRKAGLNLGDEAATAEDDTLNAVSAVIEMIGDTVVRAYLNPLEDGALPYDYMPWEKVNDSPFGYGVPYLMRAQQQVTNASWRQLMDNAGISSGPQVILKPGAIQPADGKWEITNRKIWYATDDTADVRNAFTTVQFNSMRQDLAAILELSEKLSDQETSLPMMMQGEKGSAPETVGGMQMLANNSNTMLRRLVKQYDDYVTKPHIRRYYDYNMTYSDKDEIKGDFHVNPRGSSALMIRDIQNQAFTNLLAIATNPVFAPMIDPKRLFERALRAQHVDPTDIMRTDEEINKLQQQQAQQPQPVDPRVQAAQIRAEADMARTKEQSQATMAELQLKAHMAERDDQAAVAKLNVTRDIQMARVAADQNVSLDKVKAGLANTALRENTKKQLFTAEAQIKAAQGTGI